VNLWSKSFGWTKTARSSDASAARVPEGSYEGEYQLLYEYLRDRYATTVVLTFAEIEDLLGFPLPESARLRLEWWHSPGTTEHPSAQADSWRLASRTATVNMVAQSVVFERERSREA
jgi:hypothetical protein